MTHDSLACLVAALDQSVELLLDVLELSLVGNLLGGIDKLIELGSDRVSLGLFEVVKLLLVVGLLDDEEDVAGIRLLFVESPEERVALAADLLGLLAVS